MGKPAKVIDGKRYVYMMSRASSEIAHDEVKELEENGCPAMMLWTADARGKGKAGWEIWAVEHEKLRVPKAEKVAKAALPRMTEAFKAVREAPDFEGFFDMGADTDRVLEAREELSTPEGIIVSAFLERGYTPEAFEGAMRQVLAPQRKGKAGGKRARTAGKARLSR